MGVHPLTLLKFINSYIRSILEWGFLATGNASPSLKRLLDVEYGISLKIALVCVCGLCKSVPLNVSLLLSDQLSLDSRRTWLTDKYLLKTGDPYLRIL